jgi:hypothetical protein
MKKWLKEIASLIDLSMDDLEYLLFVGLPFGIILILLHNLVDYTHLL